MSLACATVASPAKAGASDSDSQTSASKTSTASKVSGPRVAPLAGKTFTKYVALGDSYSAGPLIPWNSSWCFRSNNNYPSWLATQLGLYYKSGAFTDVTCSSAETTHLTQPQPTPTADLNLANQAPQLDALTLDTDLVTVGLGGNDYSVFGNMVYECPKYRDSDPTGSPCKDHYTVNGVDTLTAALGNTEKNLKRAVKAIRERSPGATIVMVGYPRILPPTGYCPDVVPLADGDYKWGDSLNRRLNLAVSNAAKSIPNVQYVDTYGPGLGHDACAGDAAWVNGQSTNLLAAVSYHPFAAGMKAESSLIYKQLTGSAPNAALKVPAASKQRTSSKTDQDAQKWLRSHPKAVLPTSPKAALPKSP
ncbi:GDSL family lipase [Luteipulveratus mongoliensis]|uniref:GDSL family lipase n=1 Tax=Luteipulveratus mongoliensis TaxID=571913 RepID=A0A0K1JQ43_9MICO|nr:GDSL family lipase [Luteipulveratus mongoliensis]